MERRTPHALEMHPVAVLGSLLGGRADAGPAARDAEPDSRLPEPVWPPEDYPGLARVRQALRDRRENRRPAVAPGR